MKLKNLILTTGISAALAGSFLFGEHREKKKHERDMISLSVVYANMPQVIGKAREPQVSLHGYLKGKEFRLQDLTSLARIYDPREPRVPELQRDRDLYKKILLHTSESFTFDSEGKEMPTLKDIDFKIKSSYFDESGELGDWRGYVFNITPRK